MNTDSLENIKQTLLQKKADLEQNLETIQGQDPTNLPDYAVDNTQDDDAFEREGKTRADALSDRAKDSLKKVERALAKIKEGTYGICDVCGKPIDSARLNMVPEASLCLDDQQNVE